MNARQIHAEFEAKSKELRRKYAVIHDATERYSAGDRNAYKRIQHQIDAYVQELKELRRNRDRDLHIARKSGYE